MGRVIGSASRMARYSGRCAAQKSSRYFLSGDIGAITYAIPSVLPFSFLNGEGRRAGPYLLARKLVVARFREVCCYCLFFVVGGSD